ncbi:MAG: hypothetical protein KGD63_03830 [Candidatus Lokiarchaeota archaeon]|nr:hypothetical protein [Candidatus Lokiarchaeota archaeon]
MERIVIVHWNKSTGPQALIQYPPEKESLPKNLFLKIWTIHELNKEDKMIQITLDVMDTQFISIIHKYEGEIYFLILAYNKKDNIEDIINDYPDILANIGKNLINLISTNKITRAISEAFNTIKNYSKLDKEENLLNFFKDKIKFTILKIMRNGVISKNKLKSILKNEYGFSTINLDLILMPYIRENLIIKENISGSNDCYLLINDLIHMRLPPQNSYKSLSFVEIEDKDMIYNKYLEALTEFYRKYNCIQESSNIIILNFVFDKQVYLLFKMLRKKALTVHDCVNILNNNEVLFNDLLENKFIFEARGIVLLFTDLRFMKCFPHYIIKFLLIRYKEKDISLNEFLTHLRLLSNKLRESSDLSYYIV